MNKRIENAIVEAARALVSLARAQNDLAFEAKRVNDFKYGKNRTAR